MASPSPSPSPSTGTLTADASALPNRATFKERLEKLLSGKRADNSAYMDRETYSKFIQETKEAQNQKSKTTRDFRRLKRFAVCTVNGEERLIVPLQGQQQMQFFVTTDQLYDVIAEAHLASEHKGRNVLMPMLQQKYKNVTKEAVQIYLELCPTCLLKKRVKKRGLTVKPMVFQELNDRWQIDLIDMQSSPDGEYRFIFNCQDHLTKFTHLRPLKTKTAVEVAENLLEIVLVFGAPSILQSDNGREFCNQIIESLRDMCPEMRIVHGELQ